MQKKKEKKCIYKKEKERKLEKLEKSAPILDLPYHMLHQGRIKNNILSYFLISLRDWR